MSGDKLGIRTLGRKPMLREVVDYYTREDFLRFLLGTCRTRRVVMVIPKQPHWEPNWSENEIRAGDMEKLGSYILNKIRGNLPKVSLDDRPSYYPSFHQSVGKWLDQSDEAVRESDKSLRLWKHDCVFEADLPTWRESFRDVYSIIDQMDRHGICYRHKFSGHRSLHIVIPAEVLPRGYRGKGSQELVRRLTAWSGSQAHRIAKITRMPYSLNEDTGLVCLPIERGALPHFRPWQANVHLVEIRDVWKGHVTGDNGDKMKEFIDALVTLPRSIFFFPDRKEISSQYCGRISDLRGKSAVESAWSLLVGNSAISEQDLVGGLERPELDAKWFAVEAFLLNGTGLSKEGFFKLLEQEDEYVRSAAVDVLLRFEGDISSYLVEMIRAPDRYSATGTKAFYLLSQSNSLREKVFGIIVQHTDQSYNALIIAACLMGSMARDWPGAFDVSEPVRKATGLSEKHQARLAALDLMSTMGGWNKKEEAKKSQALAMLGPDITDLLLIAAGSPSRRFRRGIVAALAILADERAVDLLIRSLGDDYSKVRRKAIAGLVRIGEKAIGPLIEAAASDQVSIRRYAVLCLGHIGTQRVKPTLLQALDDSEEVVRSQAIRGLKEMATVDDIVRLKEFLRVESWENAMAATEVMEAVGDEGKGAMSEMAFQENNPAAAYFIALHGDPRGRDILAERLSEDGEKREDAAEFLLRLGDERCVRIFADRLKTATRWSGMFAALELGRIRDETAITALIEALSRDDNLVRRGAVRALADANHPMAIEPLIRCLEDEDSKVRKLAAAALCEMGEEAKESLEKALEGSRIQGKRHRNLAKGVLRRLGVEI